jgi:hypothetical protein
MLAFDAMRTSDSSSRQGSNTVAAQVTDGMEHPIVLNCSRLGRSANPPGFSFSDWLRERRRR